MHDNQEVEARFDGCEVLVVGDVMVDRYWYGESLRVSPEAPVPVVDVGRQEDRPGAAANVALNLVALGARCVLVGAVGADEAGTALVERLEAAGVELDLVVVPDWPTITKLRVVAQRQQLMRLDFETPLPAAAADEVVQRVRRQAGNVASAVLSDYDKGVIAHPEQLIEPLKAAGVTVLVDPKSRPLADYAGADLIKPNRLEFERAGGDMSSEESLWASGRALIQAGRFRSLLVTRGDDGMTLLDGNEPAHHIPAQRVDVFDVTGAGDTVAATLAAATAAGFALSDAAPIANVAAGLAVSRHGTVAVSGPELRAALAQESSGKGILSKEQLLAAVADARATGAKVVFTNGCFDILHAGHVAYLEEARALGARLIVAVNDDASVTRLKGEGRPINPVAHRMSVLAGLQAVDWVVSFAQDTPEDLLEALQPDLLVKGGDYGPEEVVGAEIVERAGGEVRVLSLSANLSTTAIVERINDQS